MGQTLKVMNLEKYYGDFAAVKHINLKVGQGEIFALLGHNGAGKSTLIKMILGLVNPTAGEILIDGLSYRHKGKEVREIIGYLPERMNFYDNLTARETITFYAKLRRVSPTRCEEVLEQVGLSEVKDRRVGAFSKGMQQRLGLAQAIMHRPKLLVLDEPTTGLDPVGILELKSMIRSWNREGTTVFFSSHNLGDVQELAQDIAVMHKGAVVAEGALVKLLQEYKLKTKIAIKVQNSQAKEWLLEQRFFDRFGTFEVQDDTIICFCESANKINVLQSLIVKGFNITDFSVIEPGLDLVYQQIMHEIDLKSSGQKNKHAENIAVRNSKGAKEFA